MQEEHLPRSLYVTQKDPRRKFRESLDAIFSDKFMIVLSLIIIPIILLPFLFQLPASAMSFLDICDWVIIFLFVIEYLSKLIFAENRWAHFKSPWHLVDLVIIVLPLTQALSMLNWEINGSASLLLRLLRLPRALAVGSRVVGGRRANNKIDLEAMKVPDTVLRQMDCDLKTTQSHLSWDDLKAHISDKNRQEWLDLYNLSDEGFGVLSKILQIPELHFKSGIVDDVYPHMDYVQRTSFIFLQSDQIRYPEQADHYLTISRSGIIVISNGTKIITVSRHSVDLFDKVLQSVSCSEKDDDENESFVISVLCGIFDHMLNEYRSILSEIELEVIKIGKTPRSKLPRDFLERIYQMNKEVSRLVSNLAHFKDLLSIIISKKVRLEGFDQSPEEFQVLQDNATYLTEIADDLLENLRSIIDLYINQTSFETNKILKILAVITSISVVPSALGGLIGTNLLDIPYGAYLWQLSLVTGIIMAFMGYVFVKLGWLKT
jgi:Mg2+ and Co2+ transporter CorA